MRKLELTRNIDSMLLHTAYKKETEYRTKQRILMVIHVQEGKTATEIGTILKCSHNTVVKWVRNFNEKGFEGLRDVNRPGRPRKVDYEDLVLILNQKPSVQGYDEVMWYPTLVYNYLLDIQGVEIAFDYVYVLIRRAGFSLIVPRERSYKSNPDKVVLFKKKVVKS